MIRGLGKKKDNIAIQENQKKESGKGNRNIQALGRM